MNSDENLQSDVMRFMAILALCLAAIFALVKSAPLASVGEPASLVTIPPEPEPPPPEPATRAAAEVPVKHLPVPTVSSLPDPPLASLSLPPVRDLPLPPVKSVAVPRPEETLLPEPAPGPTPPEQRSGPRPRSRPVSSPLAATEPSAPVARKGFTLRFASGAALKTLVARSEVDVFARTRRDMWRLRLDDDRLRFESARAPARFHEMSHETVPADMVSALRRDAAQRDLGDVTWGATLPRRVTAQIRRAVDERDGGSLVIEADGRVSLGPEERR